MSMTKQEIFDVVATHLLTQNARSFVKEGCAYRGEGGLKCAVGVLIKDEHFDPEFNEVRVKNDHVIRALVQSGVLPEATSIRDDLYLPFLRDLQIIHDYELIMEWKNSLRILAIRNELNPSILNNF